MSQSLTVLYDSLCPVCRREVKLLKVVDRRGNIAFVDIAAVDFDPKPFGLTLAQCIGSLHAVDSSGKILEGMDTIRAMYQVAGIGWVMGWTSWQPFRSVSDAAYAAFARIRPRFSKFRPGSCHSERCDIQR
jgi:predicted DCC family thiol-disulfide oxidoreductase YuxK